MPRRSLIAPLLVALLLVGLIPATAWAATPPLPSSMVAVGDSITQAASSGGVLGADYPANSWSTGTSTTVNSHYLRLLALNPAISDRAWNLSVSGAKAVDLNSQMQGAVARQPAYLTAEIGGNDVCTDTVGQMTSVTAFRTQLKQAMDTLAAGSPSTNVFLASIPNVYRLWELFRGDWWARTVWAVGGICQSILANPTSTQAADVQRRAQVAQHNVALNTVLAEVCAKYVRCLFDGNAVYNTVFTSADAAGDYFHPSIAGQAKLAAGTWAVGYWPNGGPGGPTIHLASATGSTSTRKTGWTATVTATARDGNGAAVANATVSGAWSTGGTGSCVTAASGSCSFSLNVARKTTSVTWTVASVAASGYTYDAASNTGSPVAIAAP